MLSINIGSGCTGQISFRLTKLVCLRLQNCNPEHSKKLQVAQPFHRGLCRVELHSLQDESRRAICSARLAPAELPDMHAPCNRS